MTITRAIVTTFTEQDKETLRGMYKMVTNVNCGDLDECDKCPFEEFCKISMRADNEEDFIKEVRNRIESIG